jgi:hypothetical protein
MLKAFKVINRRRPTGLLQAACGCGLFAAI